MKGKKKKKKSNNNKTKQNKQTKKQRKLQILEMNWSHILEIMSRCLLISSRTASHWVYTSNLRKKGEEEREMKAKEYSEIESCFAFVIAIKDSLPNSI